MLQPIYQFYYRHQHNRTGKAKNIKSIRREQILQTISIQIDCIPCPPLKSCKDNLYLQQANRRDAFLCYLTGQIM